MATFRTSQRIKVMLHNDDFSRNTALQYCFEWFQHCSNIAALCWAKNRRCESSLVTSPVKDALENLNTLVKEHIKNDSSSVE